MAKVPRMAGMASVAGHKIEVLSCDSSTAYLGRALQLQDFHDIEIQHRMSKAWAKFTTYKEELTDKNYSIKARLRLFDSVVTSSALYGCSSWTMTRERERANGQVHTKENATKDLGLWPQKDEFR